MFKLKYKLHSFINKIFYFITFFVGYFLGGGKFEQIKKIFDSIFVM